MTTRRDFLKSSAGSTALLSLTAAVPNFLITSGAVAAQQAKQGDNILVVVQLTGGNDGINTVIPYADDVYHANRFATRIGQGQVLKIDDHVGLHPAMTGMAELLERGKLSVLQGVGYPNPDRSHFSSMDIWHTANRDIAEMRRMTGWIGRYLDGNTKPGMDVPALHLGAERQPLAVVAERVRVPSVSSLEGFKLNAASDAKLGGVIQSAVASPRSDARSELLSFMQKSTVSALASSRQVQDAVRNYRTDVSYPTTRLAQKLRTVAQLIDAGLSTRIYYVSLDGFDTHANQADAHRNLLKELSDAVAAFIADIEQHSHDQRVLLMTFSEFGRRVKENASRGTDHGAAAPMFLAGAKVKPGLIGKHPSMTDLDEGDLKHHTDFRQVYAAVLDRWLGADAKAVLGKMYQPAGVLRG